MTLIHKIKSYFVKHEFHLWKDFSYGKYALRFGEPSEDILLEIGSFIKDNLVESAQAYDEKFRLKEKTAIMCDSLDELLPLIRKAITADYPETLAQSREYNWQFQYFLNNHHSSKDTICVSNGLTSNEQLSKNCIYTLASIRKFEGKYYCWTIPFS